MKKLVLFLFICMKIMLNYQPVMAGNGKPRLIIDNVAIDCHKLTVTLDPVSYGVFGNRLFFYHRKIGTNTWILLTNPNAIGTNLSGTNPFTIGGSINVNGSSFSYQYGDQVEICAYVQAQTILTGAYPSGVLCVGSNKKNATYMVDCCPLSMIKNPIELVFNHNFETGNAIFGSNTITNATGWLGLFTPSLGDYCLRAGTTNRYASFMLGRVALPLIKQGIQKDLVSPMVVGSKYLISFDVWKANEISPIETSGSKFLNIYGVKSGTSLQNFPSSSSTSNLNLYGTNNTVLLKKIDLSAISMATITNPRHPCFEVTITGYDVNAIFITTDDSSTGRVLIGIDNVSITKQ